MQARCATNQWNTAQVQVKLDNKLELDLKYICFEKLQTKAMD